MFNVKSEIVSKTEERPKRKMEREAWPELSELDQCLEPSLETQHLRVNPWLSIWTLLGRSLGKEKLKWYSGSRQVGHVGWAEKQAGTMCVGDRGGVAWVLCGAVSVFFFLRVNYEL